MIRVLVVDDEAPIRTAIVRDLARNDFAVEAADSAAEGERILREKTIDVLLTDLRMATRDGIDLLATCVQISPSTRAILMSAYATARDYKTAVDLGAVQVLCKPFTPKELVDAIRQAVECAVGFHGPIHGMSLVDILQMFHFSRRSVTIELATAPRARIHVRAGEIVHAEHDGSTGQAALTRLLATSSGAIRTRVLESDEVTIDGPFDSVLLDALRAIDEHAGVAKAGETDLDADLRAFAPLTLRPPLSRLPPAHTLPRTASVAPGVNLAAPAVPASIGQSARSHEHLASAAARAWSRATATSTKLPEHAFVFAWSVQGDWARVMQGSPPGSERWADMLQPMLAHAARLAGAGIDTELWFEATADEAGVAVVLAPRAGLAMAVVDTFATKAARTWFHSTVASFARCVLEID